LAELKAMILSQKISETYRKTEKTKKFPINADPELSTEGKIEFSSEFPAILSVV